MKYVCSIFLLAGRYMSVIARQREDIEEVRRDEQLVLPSNLDYIRYAVFFILKNDASDI